MPTVWVCTVLALACAPAAAQPTPDHRITIIAPKMAPPPLREERHEARAGFEWIPGRWEWRDGKYQWQVGRWEKEHPGQRWQVGRWEQRGETWAYVEGAWGAGGVIAVVEPTSAPPPPPLENHPAKAGFEWVSGRWDWKAGKWEWMAGHWEKEHPGQHWHAGRWESRGKSWAYVEGSWGGGDAPPPPPPPPVEPPGPPGEHHHHDWKLDLPVISSYWPTKGKIGKRVVVRGRNFPPDIQVVWNANPILGAKIAEDQIVFDVPAGAVSGLIALRRSHGRDLPVGTFEIVATGDPDADAKRIADEQRKAAEAAWAAQQAKLAKDRAAREAAWQQRWNDMEQSREQRRKQREDEIRAKWDAAFLADPDTQSELTMHAQRVAQLARALDVAQIADNGKLAVRISVAQQKENGRHDQRMAALKTAFSTKGATP
jgi:hypothetical protein